jgi:hypothetical protein
MPAGKMAQGAEGHSRLRASDADREQAVEVLKAAFVQGRLDKDEFDLRVGRALASRAFADLDAVIADIPAGLTKARLSATAREPGGKKLIMRASTVVAVAGTVTTVAMPILRFPGFAGLVAGAVHGCLVGVVLVTLLTFLPRVLHRGESDSQVPKHTVKVSLTPFR